MFQITVLLMVRWVIGSIPHGGPSHDVRTLYHEPTSRSSFRVNEDTHLQAAKNLPLPFQDNAETECY